MSASPPPPTCSVRLQARSHSLQLQGQSVLPSRPPDVAWKLVFSQEDACSPGGGLLCPTPCPPRSALGKSRVALSLVALLSTGLTGSASPAGLFQGRVPRRGAVVMPVGGLDVTPAVLEIFWRTRKPWRPARLCAGSCSVSEARLLRVGRWSCFMEGTRMTDRKLSN